jgi:hypothetical protein
MGRHQWLRTCSRLALGLALVVPALSACASGGPGTQAAGEPSSAVAAPSPSSLGSPSSPSSPTSPSAHGSENPGDMTDPQLPGVQRTLRGIPAAGVEANCVLLTADDNQSYLLIGGDRALINSGSRIEVTGQVQAGLMTTCQQGIPFTVATVRKI